MEISASLKKTEVGIIPSNWKVSTLDELTTLMTNGFVGTATTYYTDSEDGVLYIQGYNVEENTFNFNGIKRVTFDFHKKHLKSCLQTGDLLTVQTGDVGLTTIVPDELAGSNCHALIISRFKKTKSDPKFFSLYLNSFQGRSRLKEIEIGSTMKHINVGDLKLFVVPEPPIEEQTSIANALSDADALIGSLQKLIAKKRQIKQGAMQSLLTGKRRLPDFENTLGVKKSIYGEIPRDWYVKPLPEVLDFFHGKAHEKFISETGKYIVVNSKFVSTDGNIKKYSNVNFAEAKNGDILMVLSDLPNGRALAKCFYVNANEKYAVNQRVCIFRTRSNDSKFLFYTLNRNPFFLSLDDGVTQTHILNNDLKNCQLLIPSKIEEQSQIAEVLSDMDAEIAALEAKLAKYQQIKQGMMQNLLTGRIRLV